MTTTAAATQTIMFLLFVNIRINANYKSLNCPLKSTISLKQNPLYNRIILNEENSNYNLIKLFILQ